MATRDPPREGAVISLCERVSLKVNLYWYPASDFIVWKCCRGK